MSRTKSKAQRRAPAANDVAKVVADIDAGKAAVQTFLVSLPKDASRFMVKMPGGGEAIARLVADLSEQQKVSLPGADAQAVRDDVGLAESLQPIATALAAFTRLIQDTIFAARSRAWSGTGTFYSALSRRAETDAVLSDALKPATELHARHGRKVGTTPPPAPRASSAPGTSHGP